MGAGDGPGRKRAGLHRGQPHDGGFETLLIFDRQAAREILAFGAGMFVSTATYFLGGEAERLILGKFVTVVELGCYSLALTVSMLPSRALMQVAGQVFFPMISQSVREDSEAAGRHYLRARLFFFVLSVIVGVGFIAYSNRVVSFAARPEIPHGGLDAAVAGRACSAGDFFSPTTSLLLANGAPKYSRCGQYGSAHSDLRRGYRRLPPVRNTWRDTDARDCPDLSDAGSIARGVQVSAERFSGPKSPALRAYRLACRCLRDSVAFCLVRGEVLRKQDYRTECFRPTYVETLTVRNSAMGNGSTKPKPQSSIRLQMRRIRRRVDIALCRGRVKAVPPKSLCAGRRFCPNRASYRCSAGALGDYGVRKIGCGAQTEGHAGDRYFEGRIVVHSFRLTAPDGTIISVDMPGAGFGEAYTPAHARLFELFPSKDQSLSLVKADSHSPETRSRVEDLLAGKKVDLLFIDGDHSYEGVKKDFEMYSPMVADGGMIAFHDIAVHTKFANCEVDRYWDEIKQHFGIGKSLRTQSRAGPASAYSGKIRNGRPHSIPHNRAPRAVPGTCPSCLRDHCDVQPCDPCW